MIIPGDAPGGIYVHVPFCRRKCGYCDFYSVTCMEAAPAYVSALEREIALYAHLPLVFDTLYIGGGTPSLLLPAELARIIQAVGRNLKLEATAEITLEANPDSLDANKLAAWRQLGVNRLIIGIQSCNDADLLFLGRPYTAARALQSLPQARAAGFENLGIDLMYGLPSQASDAWRETLQQALALEPAHISCYALTLAPATPMGQACAREDFVPATESRQARLFSLTHNVLTAAGYEHYEVSNYARRIEPGPLHRNGSRRARHNCKYWSRAPILGLGAAAHSFMPPVRFWNYRDINHYMQSLALGRLPLAGCETLTREQQRLEILALGLRTADGIDLLQYQRCCGKSFRAESGTLLKELVARKRLRLTPTHCQPTPIGMRYADGMAGLLAAM